MQHRYCHCGQPVWVQYIFGAHNCRVLFWSRSSVPNNRLVRCPHCGAALNIDHLG